MNGPTIRAIVAKFFADRGTHLAAMIAYFALLSFVPLLFLALALLGAAGRPDEESFLVQELHRAFPAASVDSIVRAVHTLSRNATTLGLVGAGLLLWSSLSMFSALESALNIVFGRPNRPFVRGKALALGLMSALVVTLFVGLLAGSVGVDVVDRFVPGVRGSTPLSYMVSILASTTAVFAFVLVVYYLLTNVGLCLRDALPGALVATAGLEVSFQALPLYLRATNEVVAAQVFGGPFVLLVWLYVMGNVIVFGAEVNWWRWHHRGKRQRPRRLRRLWRLWRYARGRR